MTQITIINENGLKIELDTKAEKLNYIVSNNKADFTFGFEVKNKNFNEIMEDIKSQVDKHGVEKIKQELLKASKGVINEIIRDDWKIAKFAKRTRRY